MNKITVVYLVSTLGRTGPTRQLFNIIKYLDLNKFSAYVITLSPETEDSLIEDFRSLNITLNCLGLSRLSGAFLATRQAKKLIDPIHPDVIHSQGIRADWVSSRLPVDAVKIATQRNDPNVDYPSLGGWILGKTAALIHYHALRQLLVVACSKSISRVNPYFRSTDRIIPNGVDIQSLRPIAEDTKRKQRRHELNLPINDRLFIFAGPLILRKNVSLLLNAFEKQWQKSNYLIIIGDGPLSNECRRASLTQGNIEYLGQISNVHDYFQIADVFISASRSEGLPNAALEALAAGTPVLLSDIPPHREILNLERAAGNLFRDNDVDDLVWAISNFEASPEGRQTARGLAETFFSSKHMSLRYQSLYRVSIAEQ
jgi:glycosyltransferase involved in cell wall biosynthesis